MKFFNLDSSQDEAQIQIAIPLIDVDLCILTFLFWRLRNSPRRKGINLDSAQSQHTGTPQNQERMLEVNVDATGLTSGCNRRLDRVQFLISSPCKPITSKIQRPAWFSVLLVTSFYNDVIQVSGCFTSS
jgi:hypothetical protein